MRAFTLALAIVLAGAAVAGAAELTSGLQPGDLVPAFNVVKAGGAVNDGKENLGTAFCYRCMLGNKPVVMVFSRNADKSLGALAKALDKHLEKNADQKLSSFINLIGGDPEALKSQATSFAAKNELQNVAVVVPEDNENGPEDFNVKPEAETTVTIYRNGKVEASHALPAGKLTKEAIHAILADTAKILN